MALGKLRHVRVADRISFPSSHPEWEMPESFRHARLCELMYQVLRGAIGASDVAGKDHFVYFDRREPRRCVAPDAFVKLGVRPFAIESWKTWEHGVPELCVEILSPSDTEEKLTFREKLRRYHALKTRELITYRADGKPGRRLRAWDRKKGELVARVVSDERTPCKTLGGWFALREEPELGLALRLVGDDERLVLTPAEARELALTRDAEARELALREEIARLKKRVKRS